MPDISTWLLFFPGGESSGLRLPTSDTFGLPPGPQDAGSSQMKV